MPSPIVKPPPMTVKVPDTYLPKVWITKYALTKGVYTAQDVRLCGASSGRMIAVSGRFTMYFHKPFWHETEAEALAHVKEMAENRIKSIMREKAKINALFMDPTSTPMKAL